MDKETNNNNNISEHAAAAAHYEFEPFGRWQRKEDRDVLQIHLPGFKEDQLEVQINNQWSVKISGELPLDASNNKKKKFYRELTVPNTNFEEDETKKVFANFTDDWLQITLPKMKRSMPSMKESEAGPTYDSKEGDEGKVDYTPHPIEKAGFEKARIIKAETIPDEEMLNMKSYSSRSIEGGIMTPPPPPPPPPVRRPSKVVVMSVALTATLLFAVILIAYVVLPKYYNT